MLLKGLNKNERQLIWRKLHPIDLQLLHCAICSTREMPKFVPYAMINGFMNLLESVQYSPSRDDLIYNVAFNGHVDVLKWAKINRNIIFHFANRGAINGGQCNVLDYLKSCGFDLMDSNHVLYCIKHGNVKTLEWFVSNGAIVTNDMIYHAITVDKYDMFLWFIKNGYTVDVQEFGEININDWINAVKGAQ
jgi:hypothetical protein